MAGPLHVSQTRTYPIPVEEAFALTLPMPLERIFSKRFGPIPATTGTTRLPDAGADAAAAAAVGHAETPWGAVGQVRTVHLADGGSVREELTIVDPPRVFGYELTQLTGPLKPLASRIEGSWAFAPIGSGCTITWSWTVHPAGTLGAAAMPVFGRVWNGFARRALRRLEGLLLDARVE